jgi:hypothetical protein
MLSGSFMMRDDPRGFSTASNTAKVDASSARREFIENAIDSEAGCNPLAKQLLDCRQAKIEGWPRVRRASVRRSL